MDRRLIAWARAVKPARHHGRALPVLWLFTDQARLPDPLRAAAQLPRGCAGVVLRDDALPGRAALGRQLARICRARGNHLVVASDAQLAAQLGAGLHLRGGHLPPRRVALRRGALLTSSAHDATQLRNATRAGAALVFLSPVFTTASHPGAAGLGTRRWAQLARGVARPILALGGVTGRSIHALPPLWCKGAAFIGAVAAR